MKAEPIIYRPVRMAGLFLLSLVLFSDPETVRADRTHPEISQGTLLRLDKEGQPAGECPLQHTSVRADLTGFLARVTVIQDFENRSSDSIEAVYTFPLPQHAAVDDMVMNVDGRVIRGTIKRREEARQIYERARQRGQTAALLDQERPNIFTQSVTHITPGAKVRITISYLETLSYEDGIYEFVFPMTVGPRYIPGQATGRQGGGWAPDTDQVPDASRITPPVAGPGTRAGHDIEVEALIDAGFPLRSVESVNHQILKEAQGSSKMTVRLKDLFAVPNKDFILRYDVGTRSIQDTLFLHHGARGGYFTLVIQPPERPPVETITPKELVFVLDTSGSMSGFPIEKAKETMRLALAGLYQHDTFNLITFAGDTHMLFPQPVSATAENLRRAEEFLSTRRGGGGTEMMKAIRAALESSGETGAIRIVCFMTDGYVGNDMEIVGEVQRHPNARVFSFGIGSSVNRFLLDAMARESRGEVEYVSLNEDGSKAARRFHQRIRQPLLTDISLDFGNLPIQDIHPNRLPDLFAAKPLIITGRFTGSARGTIHLTGKQGLRSFTRNISVNLPAAEAQHESLAALWARKRIEDLSAQDWTGMQSRNPKANLREEITRLGLEYRIMTPFTSFVAVEEKTVQEGGVVRRVEVPVEMPDGVSHEGVFGPSSPGAAAKMSTISASPMYYAPSADRIKGESVGQMARMEEQDSRQNIRKENGKPAGGGAEEEKIHSNRIHPQILQWIEEARLGRLTGEVEVEIRLSSTSPDVLARLQQLGFRSAMPMAQMRRLVGHIPVIHLRSLSRFAEILYLAPATARNPAQGK